MAWGQKIRHSHVRRMSIPPNPRSRAIRFKSILWFLPPTDPLRHFDTLSVRCVEDTICVYIVLEGKLPVWQISSVELTELLKLRPEPTSPFLPISVTPASSCAEPRPKPFVMINQVRLFPPIVRSAVIGPLCCEGLLPERQLRLRPRSLLGNLWR